MLFPGIQVEEGLIEVYQNAPSVDGEVAYMEYMGLILVINMWRKCIYSGLTNPPLLCLLLDILNEEC